MEQGIYPVISLSFAKVKQSSYESARKMTGQIITSLYNQYDFLLDSDKLNEREKEFCRNISADMEDHIAIDSLNELSSYLMKHYDRKVIILLDEYDTLMQEAYVYGYWKELVNFTRGLFNSTFKTNPCLERALMTGITRVSKESKRKVGAYWANTSTNSLAGKLIREGSADNKKIFEQLLQGEHIRMEIDEQIVYDQLAVKNYWLKRLDGMQIL